MKTLTVDFNKITGKIKPMHAVGQPPFLNPHHTDHFKYLTEANIPYSRLHDVGGPYGGNKYVDIPNIFRDFDADETDPASYDFVFTDWLIAELMKAKCPPIFRLGVTIENFCAMRSYRLDPPKDPAKWARICEHIIRHYNEGWADGFHYGIEYWEIWNEPENHPDPEQNPMWRGTKEQFFELYAVTAKHLKACFKDTIKVGGYGSCGFYAVLGEQTPEWAKVGGRGQSFVDFFEEFLQYITKENAPMEFYSWHVYGTPAIAARMADFVDETLTKYGYGDVETQLNEWNSAPSRERRGTSYASASAAATMLCMQNKKTSMLCYYDARLGIGTYGGLFNPETLMPYCTYYALKAFGELFVLENQCALSGADDEVYAVAASDNGKNALMLANMGKDTEIGLNLDASYKVYLLDQDHFLTETDWNPESFTLGENQTVLIKNY